MFQLITEIIQQFRNCFNREKTWRWFVVLVIGFMTRTDHRGVTSILAFMRLNPSLYNTMLNFFRSKAYKVKNIYSRWIKIVFRYVKVKRVAGRVLLVGDHSKVPKEGKHMPGLQTLHQDSQNSGKAEYIEGHNYGQVGTIISDNNVSRSIPLATELQKSPSKQEKEDGTRGSLVAQMLNLTCDVAKVINEPAVAVLDAYFSSEVAWSVIDKNLNSEGQRLVEIVTRAQTNTVAFETPKPPKEKKRGGAT